MQLCIQCCEPAVSCLGFHQSASESNIVRSPTSGVVDAINAAKGTITIYISPQDNHDVFAPVSGIVQDIVTENGLWHRPMFTVPSQVKTGRVRVVLNQGVEFWLEVGKPTYITNRVQLNIDKGSHVYAGERIGEIVLGSLSEVHLPVSSEILVKPGMPVVGGETAIAKLGKN